MENLEPVTHKENIRRGDLLSHGVFNREKTHCPRGHPYEGGNLVIENNGSRKCRICKNNRQRQK